MALREQIQTESLTIRIFSKNDVQDLNEFLSDLQIYTYDQVKPISFEQAQNYISDVANKPNSGWWN